MSKGESKRFVSFLFTKSNAFDIFRVGGPKIWMYI